MSRAELLDLIKLLSALESWGIASKQTIPDYLHQRLDDAIDRLTEEVLK